MVSRFRGSDLYCTADHEGRKRYRCGISPPEFGIQKFDSFVNVSSFFYFGPMAQEYPEIQGGGSLMLAWQIRGKRVLIVGGGEVRLNTFSRAFGLMI